METSIQIVVSSIDSERSALQYDRFGRSASEMPSSLRHLYESGEWRSHDVYIWPNVLALSVTGHHLADAADAALDRFRYHPPSSVSLHNLPIADTAIRKAAAAAREVSCEVRDVLLSTRKKRQFKRRRDSRDYMYARRKWMEELRNIQRRRKPGDAEKKRQRDRELLVATRAPSGMGSSMTVREIDIIFDDIESAGGTAGGLERWGRSIATIPNHNPQFLPPACDGGGVLIDNPLAYHYSCRSINPWTRVERLMFLEKFLLHGKNFRKISQYFEHKNCEDVVRFYFDNKIQLKLKQLVKDQSIRKKSSKKNALLNLSKLPKESRNIKDNFIFQGFEGHDDDLDDDDDILGSGLDWHRLDPFYSDPIARSWSRADRTALIFALCRFSVEHESAILTVWSKISVVVKTKTPRQCREFYLKYKSALGLEGYRPPKPIYSLPKRTEPSDAAIEPAARKLWRTSALPVNFDAKRGRDRDSLMGTGDIIAPIQYQSDDDVVDDFISEERPVSSRPKKSERRTSSSSRGLSKGKGKGRSSKIQPKL